MMGRTFFEYNSHVVIRLLINGDALLKEYFLGAHTIS